MKSLQLVWHPIQVMLKGGTQCDLPNRSACHKPAVTEHGMLCYSETGLGVQIKVWYGTGTQRQGTVVRGTPAKQAQMYKTRYVGDV